MNGIKSYPIILAKAMEQLIRDVDNFELADEVNVQHIQERATTIVGMLNKWR